LIYRQRWLANSILTATDDHPAVVLTGPRQVGKSTILLREPSLSDWQYRSLDDFNTLAAARDQPYSVWQGSRRIIIDEVQRVPHLLTSIKKAIDEDRARRFLLSGSANLLLMAKVSESLSGRAVYFNLLPMSFSEMVQKPPSNLLARLLNGEFPAMGVASEKVADPIPLMLQGFMPPLMSLARSESYLRWWEGYIATYLERDLRQLSQIESLVEFRRVMEAVGLRTGQVLNQTEVARDVGVNQPRVHRYLNLLESTCILKRIPSFHRNRTSRLIKSPKFYFVDPALAIYLSGYHTLALLKTARELGGFFESLILLHLNIHSDLLIPAGRIYYWRTTTGNEVDFVVEQGRNLIAVEVKLSHAPGYDDTRNLQAFLKEFPETRAGIVVHSGTQTKFLADNIIALPWTLLA